MGQAAPRGSSTGTILLLHAVFVVVTYAVECKLKVRFSGCQQLRDDPVWLVTAGHPSRGVRHARRGARRGLHAI